MSVVSGVVGVVLITTAFADLVNTLVTTATSPARFWPARIVANVSFSAVRSVARRLDEESNARARILATHAPLLLLALLFTWVIMLVTGFGLVWWAIEGSIRGLDGLGDALYYSGVVFFTVGFGEIVPDDHVPRVGALIEAFFGVVTTALVIGYLPSLYSAYSERERMLMTLDDGSNERITPTNLVMAWAPDADPARIDEQLRQWEDWVASILETHSTLPLLRLFRSHDRRQNWVTALGVLADAAVHAQIIVGASDKNGYWFLRRTVALFDEMTDGADLTEYRAQQGVRDDEGSSEMFRHLYTVLSDHGFELLPFDEAVEVAYAARAAWAPQMEYLIDALLCPRGFWSHEVRLDMAAVSRHVGDGA